MTQAEVERAVDQGFARLSELGIAWSAIAVALGATRQRARQCYTRLLRAARSVPVPSIVLVPRAISDQCLLLGVKPITGSPDFLNRWAVSLTYPRCPSRSACCLPSYLRLRRVLDFSLVYPGRALPQFLTFRHGQGLTRITAAAAAAIAWAGILNDTLSIY